MSPEVVARDVGPKGRARCGLVGTMEFMSPEVVAREEAQAASDMWSVGVLVFMMVSGGLSPFWAGSDAGTEERLVECRYRLDQPHFRHVSPQVLPSHPIPSHPIPSHPIPSHPIPPGEHLPPPPHLGHHLGLLLPPPPHPLPT